MSWKKDNDQQSSSSSSSNVNTIVGIVMGISTVVSAVTALYTWCKNKKQEPIPTSSIQPNHQNVGNPIPPSPQPSRRAPICLYCEEILTSSPVTQLGCSHTFHTHCIEKSGNSRCLLNCPDRISAHKKPLST